jgi:hypothetical protein
MNNKGPCQDEEIRKELEIFSRKKRRQHKTRQLEED